MHTVFYTIIYMNYHNFIIINLHIGSYLCKRNTHLVFLHFANGKVVALGVGEVQTGY